MADENSMNVEENESEKSRGRYHCYYDKCYPLMPPLYPNSCRGILHVIEKGDTLYSIGKRYHVSVRDLIFSNPYAEIYNLPVGVELCIPTSDWNGAMKPESRR